MKKIILGVLCILLAGGIVYVLININENTDISKGVDYSEIVETTEGITTDIVIEKGEYEEGDIVYLTYTSELNETSLLDLFVTKVSALEEGDIIALHEITSEEVETLKEKSLNVSVELTLTDEEVEEVGIQNLKKHIRAEKIQNNNETKKLQVKNKYQEKEQEYVQYKAQKQGTSDSSNSGDNGSEANNGNGNNNGSNNSQQGGQ